MGRMPGESTEAFNKRQLAEIEKALAAEPEEISVNNGEKPSSSKTEVIPSEQPSTPKCYESPPKQEQTLVFTAEKKDDLESHLNVGVKSRKGKLERKCETTVFKIGESKRDWYNGFTRMGFVVKSITENTIEAERLKDREDLVLEEGKIVKILVLGYQLDGETHSLIEPGCEAGLSPPYKIVKKPEGYFFGEPALPGPYPEVLGDLLKNHPKTKHLSEEERARAKIYVQLFEYSPDTEIKIVQALLTTHISSTEEPQSTQIFSGEEFEKEVATRLNEFFGNESNKSYNNQGTSSQKSVKKIVRGTSRIARFE
ncbi:MAG: hypothetical protein QXF25_00785 [Candidatus Pacearchaeota archaeon]